MYAHRTDYEKGYIVEYLDSNATLDTPCYKSWLLIPAENLWNDALRGFLYLLCMGYFFVGIAIASDIFMNSIEAMTSKEREVAKWDKVNNEMIRFNVRIWNETVANLTLMALGSSAPEIMLATIESFIRLGEPNNPKDSLGTFTIIGSAAFNLLIITSVCIVSVPNNSVKRIQEFGVFLLTSAWSMWAYIWMLLVVRYITPGIIDPWEAWVTLAYMPLFVFLAYCQDNGWWCTCAKESPDDDTLPVHMRILNQRPRAGSFTGHILPGKELRVLEAEKASRLRDQQEQETSIEIETPDQKVKHIETHEPQAFARARFRHAVVSAMTGGHRPHKRAMADVVSTKMRLHKAEKEGKIPEGDVLGKFTFTSDRYAVLESAGHIELDVLFHRNLPSNVKVPNGEVAFKNGSVKIGPEPEPITGIVSVEIETREGSAKAGKDFRYKSETLIFKENEYKKTISVSIINDNQFENDVDFYIILRNPFGGSGLGDPSVARVTIVDDDEPGEFEFSQDHCIADLKEGTVTVKVNRDHGFDGVVTMQYATIDGTAVGGRELSNKVDYISQQGTLNFSHAETSQTITVEINKDAKGPKNFIITLKNPSLGAKIGNRSAIVCNITKDTLGERIAEIVEEEEEEATWRGQFASAMSVGGSNDEDGNELPPTWFDYLMHFLTFFWKIVGACIPPTRYWGAWPAFVLSLFYIGCLTAVVEQLGHLIGCVIGLKTSVTGITIIALGTSLPDTFASRTAARQDEYADAAIGNVTGSNSVNVFLGLGLPWVISTMYHLARGTQYRVASGNLTQSVIIFSCVGFTCIVVLILRRKFVGGELGGKNSVIRWGSSIFLFFLWFLYIILASLKAYDILKWEV